MRYRPALLILFKDHGTGFCELLRRFLFRQDFIIGKGCDSVIQLSDHTVVLASAVWEIHEKRLILTVNFLYQPLAFGRAVFLAETSLNPSLRTLEYPICFLVSMFSLFMLLTP